MKENRLFRYQLQNVWGETLTQVDVVDCLHNNVRCLCLDDIIHSTFKSFSSADGYVTTLPRNTINEIRNIYCEHVGLFQNTEIKDFAMIDGVIKLL